jgi:hypothetical protein
MRKTFILVLVTLGVMGVLATASADPQTVKAACSSMQRPNIDCGCVANRAAVFERAAPNDTAKATIAQGYLYALGLENRYGEALTAMISDPLAAMIAVEAFDAIGGRPENISEYERGCVVLGAPKPPITEFAQIKVTKDYTNACFASTGQKRFCECDTSRKAMRVSDQEFEAYFRSFSDFSAADATTNAELSRARGAEMGISGAAFDALQSSARRKFAEYSEADSSYCNAMIWADDEVGLDEDARLEAGFEPGTVGLMAPAGIAASEAASTKLEPLYKARDIVATSCSADGNSQQYCACFNEEFETRVIQKAASPNIALSWALTRSSSSALAASEQLVLMQSIPNADHQAAGMLFVETMDIGEQCSQGPVAAADKLKGTPRERMMQICVADNADEALCGCMVDKMQAQFSEDDFELIVDIREADFNGADDALATVAEERGLTAEEAETALMNNPAIIGGAMAMGSTLMQCMGGMPTMPMFPGMPQQ